MTYDGNKEELSTIISKRLGEYSKADPRKSHPDSKYPIFRRMWSDDKIIKEDHLIFKKDRHGWEVLDRYEKYDNRVIIIIRIIQNI